MIGAGFYTPRLPTCPGCAGRGARTRVRHIVMFPYLGTAGFFLCEFFPPVANAGGHPG